MAEKINTARRFSVVGYIHMQLDLNRSLFWIIINFSLRLDSNLLYPPTTLSHTYSHLTMPPQTHSRNTAGPPVDNPNLKVVAGHKGILATKIMTDIPNTSHLLRPLLLNIAWKCLSTNQGHIRMPHQWRNGKRSREHSYHSPLIDNQLQVIRPPGCQGFQVYSGHQWCRMFPTLTHKKGKRSRCWQRG